MSPHDALILADPQRHAADPRRSAFVTANAGSGKTKTLIDRVARLLLAGARPEAILCVTYTKAAAAEMQRRLYRRLGDWSVTPDADLRRQLADLLGEDGAGLGRGELSRARALFAKALETPGGLKIQTIHAFCEKLLRRFPLEAGVSPGFKVMDDPAAAAVAAAARKAVARHALIADDRIAQAYARFSVALDFASFHDMFAEFEARRSALAAFLAAHGGLAGAEAWVWGTCELAPGTSIEDIERAAVDELDRDLLREAAEVLGQGGATDQKCAANFAALAASGQPAYADLMGAFFTEKGEGGPIAHLGKTSTLKSREGLRQALLAEQDRLTEAREQLRSAKVAGETLDALVLAAAYLAAYEIEKGHAGALDFGDLVEKACQLLADQPSAAWVLYKLDGGIDHMLVDEAQDTAPDQWTIVRALTGEFFSGAGVTYLRADVQRTVFVVGDEKQSIYSFQGADPRRLREETEGFMAQIAGAGCDGAVVPLVASWRSTIDVLAFVDAVFPAGVPPSAGEALRHEPKRLGQRGCVDIWPLVQDPKGEAREAWDAPLDAEGEESANRRLARAIAAEIKRATTCGEAVHDEAGGGLRPVGYRDFLVLVRRRGALFDEILRALKQAGVPVGGADRLALSAHIAFDDLLALPRFAQFPGDDLTLAALLRSPFCDVSDDSLYRLARGRKGALWTELEARAAEAPEWTSAHAFLQAMIAARSRRPYEFFAQALNAVDGEGRAMRARLLRRLGREAEDALDEFLAQVLAAEGRGIDDLETLASDFASLDIVVKREMEAGRDEVRVMTAHGAKGLEAPIVFLPEAAYESRARGSSLLETEDGGVLWSPGSKSDCAAAAAARQLRQQKDDEESLRLLYVALTRARERLVVCGRLASNRKEETLKGWWEKIVTALTHADIGPEVREVMCGDLMIRRFGPDPQALGQRPRATVAEIAPPAWTRAPATAEAFARYASPSTIGAHDRGSAPSPLLAQAGLGRFRRGDVIHRLLQILPDIAVDERREAAEALLGREPDLTDAHRREMTAAAFAVLEDARFAEVFGPGSRPEVPVAGGSSRLPAGLSVSGRVDRLVVLPDRVLVVDFKTNRPAPARIEMADPAYVRQMAIYAAVLGEIFPRRVIEAALVWTDGPKLMPVPEILMAEALADLGRSS